MSIEELGDRIKEVGLKQADVVRFSGGEIHRVVVSRWWGSIYRGRGNLSAASKWLLVGMVRWKLEENERRELLELHKWY